MMQYSAIGAGSWGTALANLLANNDISVKIFARNTLIAEEINSTHTNQSYLPNIKLNPNLTASTCLTEAFQANKLILAIPAQKLREFLLEFKENIDENSVVILCAKGIEQSTGLFMSQIIQEILPKNNLAIISGPSFAADVAMGLPSAVTIAANNIDLAQNLALDFSSQKFRCYSSDDIIGVQIGGAFKNIFAIASGALQGCTLGESAKAAFIARAFAEMRRIGHKLGGRAETIGGLSGLGDLILSCNSAKSRNFALGYALSTQQKCEDKLAEGYYTTKIAAKICQDLDIDAPLLQATYKMLYENYKIADICQDLLSRPLKIED